MAKANVVINRVGNDGYEYARRADGVWFFREGYCGAYGWAKTKWREAVDASTEPFVLTGLEKLSEGETSYHYGFGHLVVITDGKGLRLP